MTLTSPSIKAGRPVPSHNSCRTDDVSPALRWTPGPKGTVEYAIIVDDPDTKGKPFTMWTVWDVDARYRALPENHVTPGAHQGRNDNGIVGYSGPCFPERARHHYRFAVFALSGRPAMGQGAVSSKVRALILPLVIGAGTLIAKGY